jgi:PHS family inorganic phosphate transporter-like MFS transporter
LVAFLGFLASSWSLIAVTIVTPALYFVYNPEHRLGGDAGLVLDMVTLTGTVLGMVIFGHLADRFGRSSLYGIEIVIVLGAVGGATFSSEGYMAADGDSSLSIYPTLFFWRFCLGLGIGAEQVSLPRPLVALIPSQNGITSFGRAIVLTFAIIRYPMSAVIATEFSPIKYRGTMLTLVFLAQSIGRFLAYAIGLGVLRGLSHNESSHDEKVVMDRFWRIELALAGIPAIFAVFFRFTIPETPRFYSAIKRDVKKTKEALRRIGSKHSDLEQDMEAKLGSDAGEAVPPTRKPWGKSAKEYYFGAAKGWKKLAAISIQWTLLDMVFYATGLDAPGTLAALWLEETPRHLPRPVWSDDPGNPGATITEALDNNLTRTLKLSSVTALIGSLTAVLLINRVSRKTYYIWSTLILCVLFACTAISVSQSYATSHHESSMVFYSLAQLMFNIGPNTLTFVLAAEIFPTEFRGTSYGIAAACGKIGAIIARAIVEGAGKEKEGLVTVLSVFTVVLFIMALLVLIEPLGIGFPKVQEERTLEFMDLPFLAKLPNSRLGNKSLEEIAPWPLAETTLETEAPRAESISSRATSIRPSATERRKDSREQVNGHGCEKGLSEVETLQSNPPTSGIGASMTETPPPSPRTRPA